MTVANKVKNCTASCTLKSHTPGRCAAGGELTPLLRLRVAATPERGRGAGGKYRGEFRTAVFSEFEKFELGL